MYICICLTLMGIVFMELSNSKKILFQPEHIHCAVLYLLYKYIIYMYMCNNNTCVIILGVSFSISTPTRAVSELPKVKTPECYQSRNQ